MAVRRNEGARDHRQVALNSHPMKPYPKTESELRIQISEMGIEAGLIEAELAHENVRHPARPKSTNEYEQWGLLDTHLASLHTLKNTLDSAKGKKAPSPATGTATPTTAKAGDRMLTPTEKVLAAKGCASLSELYAKGRES